MINKMISCLCQRASFEGASRRLRMRASIAQHFPHPEVRPKGASKDGFTLVEVLVAMAILGTVVISMMALMTSQARTLSDIEEKVFAGIVAENVLAQTMAARQSPNISVTSGEEQLAGRDWAWTQNVTRHEDLPLLQISVVVTRAEQPQVLSTLTALRGSE